MAYADPSDVERTLGRSLTDAEDDQVNDWLDDAALMIDGEGYVYTGDTIPAAFIRVSVNMTVRAIRAADIVPGAQTQEEQTGPFLRAVTYPATAVSGGVWLSAADRLMLRPYRAGGGMVSLQLASERRYMCDES